MIVLILFLSSLSILINMEWEINCTGITCYILFGKIKSKNLFMVRFLLYWLFACIRKGKGIDERINRMRRKETIQKI